MSVDSLGDRMKRYEDTSRFKLLGRTPKILRLDGRAFHTFLANAKKPYDDDVRTAMSCAAEAVLDDIGGTARLAYIQSDECSIVLNDALDLNTQAWFDNNLQKTVSISASVFTYEFNDSLRFLGPEWHTGKGGAYFDARLFCVPNEEEVVNYLIWRQQDATRNSVRMYASTYFSHSQLDGKSNAEAQDMMMLQKGFNWNDAPTWTKRGWCLDTATCGVDYEIPIFTQNRDYVLTKFRPEVKV